MTEDTSTPMSELIAIHEPLRRRLVELLAAQGPSKVTTLASATGRQVGSISHHLRTLERAGFVEPAPELATDARTSWWRLTDRSWQWSPDDFDHPADHHQARTAERLTTRHHGELLNAWGADRDRWPEAWRRSAFSTDVTTLATATELADLLDRLDATIQGWLDSIPRDDGQERRAVVFFGYGCPLSTSD